MRVVIARVFYFDVEPTEDLVLARLPDFCLVSRFFGDVTVIYLPTEHRLQSSALLAGRLM